MTSTVRPTHCFAVAAEHLERSSGACCIDVSTATLTNPNGTITYDRHSFNAIVSKADLVEYYLPAFEACATEVGDQLCRPQA